MKKIGIFGGTFDPPHIGHETIILKSIDALKLDQVFVVPTYKNSEKIAVLNAEVRLSMVKLLIDHINNDKVIVSN